MVDYRDTEQPQEKETSYSVPKKIAIVFYNGYNYDYHFIIQVPVKEF